ncbi:MAG TPA: response regulator transcription factor [Flavisolibacter sp.]|nr:response regulator transcription factor [Flavisolibacter sp.]
MNQLIKLLLADDHPMFLEGVRNALQKFEHLQIVAECTDGNAVEACLRRQPVDVAVLDVNMPGKNGLELARIIRQAYPHIKIVFLTMYHPEALAAEALDSPFSQGYVLKNSGSHVLCEAVETAHAGKVYIDPKLKDAIHLPSADVFPSAVKLSSREKEIIKLILQGKGNREMAEDLFISELTIKTHRKNIYSKLDVRNVAELIRAINRKGIRLN